MKLNKEWANSKGVPNRLKNRMLTDQNEMLNSMDTSQEPNSLSDHDITLIGAYEEIKRNQSEDTSRNKFYNSLVIEPEPIQHKLTFEPISIDSNNHKSLLKRTFQKQSQIEFKCFGDKKIVIEQSWIREWENQLLAGRIQKQAIQCWEIIQEVIKRLCLGQYNFQPVYVRPETFKLYVEEKLQASVVQQCINQKEVSMLFQKKKIILRRTPRTQLFVDMQMQSQKELKEQIVVEVLSPDKRDIVEQIEKTKSVANLKQKISTYYYHIVGQVVLISYSQFKLVDNQTQISALPENVLEIYQTKHQYIDPSFVKRGTVGPIQSKQCFQILTEENLCGDLNDTFVNEDWMYGRLWLRIEDRKLVQRKTGGLVGYVQGDRIRTLNLITLTGIKISDSWLKLQFQSKEGAELIVYQFEHANLLKQVVSHILIVTRVFNHCIANLE